MKLPTDPKERKQLQLYTFMFNYFPDAWLEVVRIARLGNEQHNPGEPLHWARGKSTDQMNAAFNHVFDYGTGQRVDSDGGYHLAKAIWRLMAQLQLDVEQDQRDQMVHWTPLPEGYPSQATLIENGWLPTPRQRLPFPSIVAASTNDPLAKYERVTSLAMYWGSEVVNVGAVGHLNPAAGYGEWPDAEGFIARLAA